MLMDLRRLKSMGTVPLGPFRYFGHGGGVLLCSDLLYFNMFSHLPLQQIWRHGAKDDRR